METGDAGGQARGMSRGPVGCGYEKNECRCLCSASAQLTVIEKRSPSWAESTEGPSSESRAALSLSLSLSLSFTLFTLFTLFTSFPRLPSPSSTPHLPPLLIHRSSTMGKHPTTPPWKAEQQTGDTMQLSSNLPTQHLHSTTLLALQGIQTACILDTPQQHDPRDLLSTDTSLCGLRTSIHSEITESIVLRS